MMDEQNQKRVDIKTDKRPQKLNVNDLCTEPPFDVDPELRHIISEVHEWEAGLLDDFGHEW